ncbi:phosphotransferase family protein [Streptomyces sp. NPDC055400]
MAPESTTAAWRLAVELSGDEQSIEGPLRGYHHETYVIPSLDANAPLPPGRWKCREPRSGLLWFDRRCFESEEPLISALTNRVTRIPEIFEVEEVRLQRFIEGESLGALCGAGDEIPPDLIGQLITVFREMAAVRPDSLSIARNCAKEDQAPEGDSAGFLDRLIRFTEKQVYDKNQEEFGELFARLGVDRETFTSLRKHVLGLVERPFCLLHADLHRENLIIDNSWQLWVIDWELAMFGDPLYDLATHLYLMRYPKAQEVDVITSWCQTVEDVREGSSRGWEKDLPLLIDYKKVQSVYTDVIRSATALSDAPQGDQDAELSCTARKLRQLLFAAERPMGLEPGSVPTTDEIAGALRRWLRSR